ncbi:nitroreductase family deazaflavin-dependent oxidoreductase [Streptomyces sp. SID13666]|nr:MULTISPECIES: nitroreductase family deazaflavin-dependent oxidoreductase [unclassified Streptomyces]NEA57146.1 nitroreductase family deazaflavin-dependent oxidoreductase [Streptomyces sp. SID13666]NEA76890.1 nitroreductase family deazaflavin-dependent oxidoreductase [Streptomyces sp. SID13588]QNA77816.1 nitroreductase family deazaflavin-dependent oxidoreductase [Streptomyces sp. So13.3]
MGHRVLLLTHTGRTSGQPRLVVLEVTGRNATTGAYHLASGFGPTSQWYQNVLHSPHVTIQVGGTRMPAIARPMTPEESGHTMAAYAPLHPRTARRLMGWCGIDTDGTADDYYQIGHDHIPFVEITPTPGAPGDDPQRA